jgi:hypothetical protein
VKCLCEANHTTLPRRDTSARPALDLPLCTASCLVQCGYLTRMTSAATGLRTARRGFWTDQGRHLALPRGSALSKLTLRGYVEQFGEGLAAFCPVYSILFHASSLFQLSDDMLLLVLCRCIVTRSLVGYCFFALLYSVTLFL